MAQCCALQDMDGAAAVNGCPDAIALLRRSRWKRRRPGLRGIVAPSLRAWLAIAARLTIMPAIMPAIPVTLVMLLANGSVLAGAPTLLKGAAQIITTGTFTV